MKAPRLRDTNTSRMEISALQSTYFQALTFANSLAPTPNTRPPRQVTGFDTMGKFHRNLIGNVAVFTMALFSIIAVALDFGAFNSTLR
jgi:hypothetical protein